MRLFIDNHYFLSVIENGKNLNGDIIYSCQVMELIHGMGMINATIQEDQSDVVSGIVLDKFSKCELKTIHLNEIFKFHLELLLQLK